MTDTTATPTTSEVVPRHHEHHRAPRREPVRQGRGPPRPRHRDSPRHEIEDLTVTTQLRGAALADSYTDGDNAKVLATDTQKITVYAFAREHGVHTPEDFLLRLGRHFTTAFDWYDGATLSAEQHSWERIAVDGAEHDHAFVRSGRGTRTAVVQFDGEDVHVLAGVTDLTVLKSTGSEFHGFPRDGYTTLAETDDRILATSVTRPLALHARGRRRRHRLRRPVRGRPRPDARDLRRPALARAPADPLRDGPRGDRGPPEIAEVRFAMPNKHHFLVDLAPFGLDNRARSSSPPTAPTASSRARWSATGWRRRGGMDVGAGFV